MITVRDQEFYMRLELMEPPAVEPLTAAEARARLNIGSEVDDDTVNAWIMASRQILDGATGYLNRALITQTWRAHLDYFPAGRLYIPLPPLQDLTVSYTGADGSEVTLTEGTDYRLIQNAQRPYIMPIGSWPTSAMGSDSVTLDFVAGYGDDGSSVPEPIRSAIALGASYIKHMSATNLTVTMEREEGIGETRYGIALADVGTSISNAVQALVSVYRVVEV